MQMTDSEIVRDYNGAADKNKQIGILADLNCCSKEDVVYVLEANGVKVDKRVMNRGIPKNKPREFKSGAVRDNAEGKGRFDLLPWCAIIRLAKLFESGALHYGERNWEKGIPAHSFLDSAFRHLSKYADGYMDEDHLIAAAWNILCLAWTEEKRPECMDIPSRKEKDK